MDVHKIQVLVADDSAFRREALAAVLQTDPSIEVVATAADGRQALEKTLALRPHVITMDIEMPVMDGFTAIDAIMRQIPTPIVAVSGMDVRTVTKALSLGAMDFVVLSADLETLADELIEKVTIASRVRPIRRIDLRRRATLATSDTQAQSFEVAAIGVSTGGPSALFQMLAALPPNLPLAIVVVQHMVPGFIGGLVEHLQSQTPHRLCLASHGQRVERGTVLFAPDGNHLQIGPDRRVRLVTDHALPGRYVPSVDVTMESVAWAYRTHAIGVLMTGMGTDGVAGMRAIREAGGTTLAQDEETSAVFGMNRAAIESGCVDKVIALNRLGDEIASLCSRGAVPQATAHFRET